MAREDDVRQIAAQEKALAFEAFDEAMAFRLGVAIRDLALARGHGIATEIRTGLRPLFYSALPGSTADGSDSTRSPTVTDHAGWSLPKKARAFAIAMSATVNSPTR